MRGSRIGVNAGPLGRALALALAVVLAGCGTATVRQPDIARPAAARISAFTLNGRLAVHNGETRYIAGVSWQHSPGGDTILLSGPLGQGLAELVRDGSGSHLTLADHRQYAAAELDELSQQVFGVRLPLAEMTRWVVGDSQGAEIAATDDTSRPQRMAAAGWTIDLLERESEAPGALPTLIDVHRDDLGARLKVLEWQDVH
jgi:outer membrane lipoprotein LolB